MFYFKLQKAFHSADPPLEYLFCCGPLSRIASPHPSHCCAARASSVFSPSLLMVLPEEEVSVVGLGNSHHFTFYIVIYGIQVCGYMYMWINISLVPSTELVNEWVLPFIQNQLETYYSMLKKCDKLVLIFLIFSRYIKLQFFMLFCGHIWWYYKVNS